jgi:hypothetical protein
MGSIFSNLKLGIVTTLSEYSHILNLGLKVLGLGRTLYLGLAEKVQKGYMAWLCDHASEKSVQDKQVK